MWEVNTGQPRLATDVLPGAAPAAVSSAQGQPGKQQPQYTSTPLQSGIATATTATRDGPPELPPLTVRVVAGGRGQASSQLASGPATPGSLGSGASRDAGRGQFTGPQRWAALGFGTRPCQCCRTLCSANLLEVAAAQHWHNSNEELMPIDGHSRQARRNEEEATRCCIAVASSRLSRLEARLLATQAA
jgi:hypothetical protein